MLYFNFSSLLFVFCLLSLGYEVNGLKCYECEGCGDPFFKIDNKTPTALDAKLVSCPSEYSTCIKSYRNGNTYRKCSPQCVQTGYRLTSDVRGDFCCLTDACNLTGSKKPAALLILFFTLLISCYLFY